LRPKPGNLLFGNRSGAVAASAFDDDIFVNESLTEKEEI
jgi:hypothetical protein